MLFILLSILSCFSSIQPAKIQQICKQQRFGNESIACVCDEKYCDTFNPRLPRKGEYLAVVTNKAGLRFSTSYRPITRDVHPNIDTDRECRQILKKKHVTLKLDRRTKGQKIIGFGGGFTDTTGYNLNQISEELRNKFFQSYFTEDGLLYNMGRIPIGHSDFSLDGYYYDDTPHDVNMTDWRLHTADWKFKIPYLKRAQSVVKDELLMVSGIWTVPKWMRKYNEAAGYTSISDEYFGAYTEYIVKFLEAYRSEGLNMWATNYANEPTVNLNGKIVDFAEEMFTTWPINKLANYAVDYFGPILQKRGFGDTKILFFDDNRDIMIPAWSQTFLDHPGISKYLELVGLHSYNNPYVTTRVVDEFQAKVPNVTFLTTEFCSGHNTGVDLGSWKTAEDYANAMIGELNHHTSGWIDWNLALDMEGGPQYLKNLVDAPIIIDAENKRFFKQPSYYTIGQFSKFMPRGSVKVDLASPFLTDIQFGAVLRPDRLVTVILYNDKSHETSVSIQDGRTQVDITLTPHSITTVVF